MIRRLSLAGLLLFAVGTGSAASAAEPDWREKATEADQQRVEGWRKALAQGVAGVVATTDADKLSARGRLFDSEAALPNGRLPEGLYHCAVTKLDGNPTGGLPYIAYPAFRCRVVKQGDRYQFTKLTGSQLTTGWIYPEGDRQSVYIGTAFYGYEDRAMPYGQSEKRDQIAVVHRVGKQRWRMVFPFPYYESVVNVMELVPVSASPAR